MVADNHFQRLNDQIRNGTMSARLSAILELQRVSDPRVEAALFEAIHDGNAVVRMTAARILVDMDRHRPAPPLVAELRVASASAKSPDEPLDSEELLAFGLVRLLSIPVVEILRNGLASPDPTVRELSVMGLGDTANVEAVAPLATVLRHGGPRERRLAAEALGRLEFPAAAEFLTAALDDDDRRVRRLASRSLRQLGSPG